MFKQVLPTNIGPEGGKAIPQRNLLVVASEKDSRGTARSTITIYHLAEGKAEYPTLVSMRDPEVRKFMRSYLCIFSHFGTCTR